jgi:hypothetical protein
MFENKEEEQKKIKIHVCLTHYKSFERILQGERNAKLR